MGPPIRGRNVPFYAGHGYGRAVLSCATLLPPISSRAFCRCGCRPAPGGPPKRSFTAFRSHKARSWVAQRRRLVHAGCDRQAVEALKWSSEAALIYCNFLHVDEHSVKIERMRSRQASFRQLLEARNYVPHQTAFIRREASLTGTRGASRRRLEAPAWFFCPGLFGTKRPETRDEPLMGRPGAGSKIRLIAWARITPL